MSNKKNISNWTKEMDDILRSEFPKSEGLSVEESKKLKLEIIERISKLREKEGLLQITWRGGIWNHARKLGLKWHRPVSERNEEEKINFKELKKASVWKAFPELTERLTVFVRDRVLKEKGTEYVHKMLNEEFKNELRDAGCTLSKQVILRKIPDVLWTPEVLKLINEIKKRHEPFELFLEHCPHAPIYFARKKWRELGGVSIKRKEVRFVGGMGRIASAMEDEGAVNFHLPRYSFSKPLKIQAEGNWSVSFLNGVNLGIPYGGVIKNNPARKALEDAKLNDDIAVIVTNLLDIDTKKAAGPAKAGRSFASGRNVNPENFDVKYAKKVREMLKDNSRRDIIYETVEELFLDSMYGWRKIIPKKNGRPEFTGDILIVLGHKEQLVIFAAAYWETRYWTKVKQDKIKVKIAITRKALAVAQSENNKKKVKSLIEEIQELQNEEDRTIASHTHASEFQRYIKHVTAFVVKKLEEAIPNSRVIGMGTTYVKVGDELIQIYIPKHARVSDSLLANYTRSYGPKVLREKMASSVVICHPYALNYRETVRECDKDGKRGDSVIFVAPITVDEGFLREVSSDIVSTVHPIFKAVDNEQFQAGLLRLECVNGIVSSRNLSVNALGVRPKQKKKSKNGLSTKFIYTMVITDPHFGTATREHFDIGDGILRGVSESVIEMMRREKLCSGAKMPVHMIAMPDDPTQGNHFPRQQQPHEEEMSYPAMEKHYQKLVEEAMRTGDVKKLRQIVRKVRNFGQNQFLRRGEYWTQSQMLWFIEQVIEQNLDFFESVISRGVKAGLEIRGPSDFKGVLSDTRDIGLINFGTGNHFLKSVNGEMTEGVIYAKLLQSLLRTIPKWRNKKQLLEKLVRAPLYGNICVGYGTVRAPDGYEWGFDIRSSPPSKGTRWEDPLFNYVRIDMRRGNPSRIMNKRKTIKIVGDKHFFATVNTSYALYHMSAPDTPTDVFAEWAGAFPPNNTGMSFIGIPAEGPDSGPIIIRTLRCGHIRDYFANKISFDWEAFLPNPV